MSAKTTPSFFTLLLMISFASVNAVLFTPALPAIARFFAISNNAAQQTMTGFLIGYTLGQLIYAPLANRFGRKPALYTGIYLQIMSSLLCVLAGMLHEYPLLLLGRFLLALGSGVGLKMTFTLVNEYYPAKIAHQKIAYLMLAFAITPGLATALGGILNAHYGWMSCFYASALYGVILLLLATKLPETQKILDLNALKLKHLFNEYCIQFKNRRLLAGGLLMGSSTCFIYIFAAMAPFIAINMLNMSSTSYGIANILPPIGLLLGLLCSAKLTNKYSYEFIIRLGIGITSSGTILLLAAMLIHLSALFALFLPMIVICFGLSLVLPSASSIAMSQAHDKAHGSAVMNFINMGLPTLIILSFSLFPLKILFLPVIYIMMCGTMTAILQWLYTNNDHAQSNSIIR